ncbi:hypothetical protein [Geobacter sulfurreducens]|uniref:hypothetical protein n=1 Tax=Geobacter sulfurreducens TaxID=35554 RepID=UPI000DBAE52A|nr:hypothetical protein [Geobacter sulfurreducens]BBA69209.1 hypothetical protein YM18_0661 [Geobacter sulfurreducens]
MRSGLIRIVSLLTLVAALLVCSGIAECSVFAMDMPIADTCCPVQPQEQDTDRDNMPVPCSDAACACPSCLVADEHVHHAPAIPHAEGHCGAVAVRSLPPSPVAPPIEYPPESA